MSRAWPANVIDDAALPAVRREAQGRVCVLATGCFDLLHVGHAAFLAEARAQGDLLVVGVNSDRAVAAIKGEDRPFVPQADRAALVAALGVVDYAFVFDDTVADRWIASLSPDVFVMGRESVEAYPGEVAAAGAAGARVHAVDRVGPSSTTTLVGTIASRAAGAGEAGTTGATVGDSVR